MPLSFHSRHRRCVLSWGGDIFPELVSFPRKPREPDEITQVQNEPFRRRCKIWKHSVFDHSYVDDSQLEKSAPPPQIPDLFLYMQKCIDDIESWMTLNKLKLNDDKTEAMIVSSGRKSRSLSFSFPNFVIVGSASVALSDCQKHWCYTWLPLDYKTHASNLVRIANFELRRISFIRHLLSTDATKILVSAFGLSRLDYCNCLLSGCPQYLLNKLQKVQNNAARLVLRVSKTDHISPHLAPLHWLPIDSRIQYKLFSLL